MAINPRVAARREAEIAFLWEEQEKLKDLREKRRKEAAEKSAAEGEYVFYSEEDREKENEYPTFGNDFLESLEEDEPEYLSAAEKRNQKTSDSMFNTYNTGEEWLMSDEGGDDLAKGFINNFRSAIGTGIEDFAFWLTENAPWYKPAQNVVEKNTAGKIEKQAQRNFGNAEANGVNGKVVDFLDNASKSLGYGILGFKAGDYVQTLGEGFDEYRRLREQGYSIDEATKKSASKIPIAILSTKADDYIGKNNKVDDALFAKNGIINDYSEDTRKFISKQEDIVHKQMDNLKTDVLNKKFPKKEVEKFEIRIDERIREITNSGYSQEEMEKRFDKLRSKLNDIYNQKTKFLAVEEYAHVMSETATHTPSAKWKNGDFSKPIKNDLYDVDNEGFSEFKITNKKPIY